MVIEVIRSVSSKSATKKKILEYFKHCPTLQEVYIYIYTTEKWTKFVRINGEILQFEDEDYSKVVDDNLDRILNFDKF